FYEIDSRKSLRKMSSLMERTHLAHVCEEWLSLSPLPQPSPNGRGQQEICTHGTHSIFSRRLSDRHGKPDRTQTDAREHGSHAVLNRFGSGRRRAVSACEADRISGIRAFRTSI